ncbi:hypothetical protein Q5752_003276 [Cryptotrichosporon argae]
MLLAAAAHVLLRLLGLSPPARDSSILALDTVAHLGRIRDAWNQAGVGIALVTSPSYDGALGWHSETLSFGNATGDGKPWDADVRDQRRPVQSSRQSRFAIASNSKLFTALAIGLLVTNGTQLPGGGTLDWSTKVKDVLPDWQLMDTVASEHVDLTDLLLTPPGQVVKSLRDLPPSAELRQTFQYNNLHYTTLSHIVPTLTGTSFVDYVRAHILGPLDMAATTYNHTAAGATGRRVEGFSHVGRNATRCRAQWDDAPAVKDCVGEPVATGWWADGDGIEDAGPGGIITTLNDLTKWLRELLEPAVLPASLVAKVATPLVHAFESPDPELGLAAYGFGQVISSYRSRRVVSHTGGVPGQSSVILRLPDKGIALAVLVNDDSEPQVFYALAYAVLDDLLGLEPIDWSTRFMRRRVYAEPDGAPLPAHPRPAIAALLMAGTYTHSAYPSLRFEPFDAAAHGDLLAHLDGDRLNLTGPVLVSRFETAFTSRAVLTHYDGDYWNCTLVLSHGDRQLHLPMQTASALVADDGIGMFGNFWGQGAALPVRQPHEGRQCAEVWFGRE